VSMSLHMKDRVSSLAHVVLADVFIDDFFQQGYLAFDVFERIRLLHKLIDFFLFVSMLGVCLEGIQVDIVAISVVQDLDKSFPL